MTGDITVKGELLTLLFKDVLLGYSIEIKDVSYRNIEITHRKEKHGKFYASSTSLPEDHLDVYRVGKVIEFNKERINQNIFEDETN